MTPSRRKFVQLTAGAAAVRAVLRPANAQTYPSRPVRILVGLAPGGVNDILARLVGQSLSERLGQPFVIENRPGASGNIATEIVVKAPADGYTLLLVGSQNTVNAALFGTLYVDFMRDIAPVASMTRQPNVMMVNPLLPAKTVPQFIDYAKSNSVGLNMASTGSGTPSHVAGELFKMMTGAKMTHVPYRGGVPALTDLIGGQVQVYFGAMASALEFVRAGKVHALAITAAARVDVLPDVPTVSEFVAGYEASGLFGIGAPRSTPAEIINKLNRETNAALADPNLKARLADLGGMPLTGSPAEFGRLIVSETEKWAKVINFAGIKPE
jgi:tripartite-type tricarboxylate transporter receptor subunit TctC